MKPRDLESPWPPPPLPWAVASWVCTVHVLGMYWISRTEHCWFWQNKAWVVELISLRSEAIPTYGDDGLKWLVSGYLLVFGMFLNATKNVTSNMKVEGVLCCLYGAQSIAQMLNFSREKGPFQTKYTTQPMYLCTVHVQLYIACKPGQTCTCNVHTLRQRYTFPSEKKQTNGVIWSTVHVIKAHMICCTCIIRVHAYAHVINPVERCTLLVMYSAPLPHTYIYKTLLYCMYHMQREQELFTCRVKLLGTSPPVHYIYI